MTGQHDNGDANYRTPRIRLDRSINYGHILTTLVIVLGGVSAWFSMREQIALGMLMAYNNAKEVERVEKRVETIENDGKMLQREILDALQRIADKVERKVDR